MQAGERREQLLDATKAIVAERGFHAVSIEAVAREAGITRPIVYGHFNDLPGLLEALVERETARALASSASSRRPRRAATRARRSWRACAPTSRPCAADPATWRLVLMPPEGAPAILRDLIAQGRAAILAQLAHVGPARPGPRVARPRADRRTCCRRSPTRARACC